MFITSCNSCDHEIRYKTIKRERKWIDTRFVLSLQSLLFFQSNKINPFLFKNCIEILKDDEYYDITFEVGEYSSRTWFFMSPFSFFYDESGPIKGITIMMVS